ncbi:tripartite motif-containing protein 3-like [Saccostrea cucullata]|uniref:tripartite motif-containing protein 3-like n=1 Tax=Saccostrea cuccullata TaxID=36930 RepID=UPI002ED1937E
MSDIKDDVNSLEVALACKDITKVYSVKSNIEKYSKLLPEIEPSLPKFTPGKIEEYFSKLFGSLSSGFLTSDKHGYSMRTIQKSPPVKQLLDEPETDTTINTVYGWLYNVTCLSDEKIWTSGGDGTMKLYSINQGSLLKSITTKSGYTPSNIAVTKSWGLVYTDDYYKTVNIVKNEKIEELIRLKTWNPHSVCSTSSGDLLVIMISDDRKQTKVVRSSGSTEKQTIQFDDKGKPFYSNSHDKYIKENKNLDICVSDYGAGAVVVVNQAGELRFRYTGHTPAPKSKPFNPQGIATDSQSHILTADYDNRCVHIIDKDGQFLRYIGCELNGPLGLCIDTNDNLLVVSFRNKQVKKIKYLQ